MENVKNVVQNVKSVKMIKIIALFVKVYKTKVIHYLIVDVTKSITLMKIKNNVLNVLLFVKPVKVNIVAKLV